MKTSAVMSKIYNVVMSCETIEQFKTAVKYSTMLIKQKIPTEELLSTGKFFDSVANKWLEQRMQMLTNKKG